MTGVSQSRKTPKILNGFEEWLDKTHRPEQDHQGDESNRAYRRRPEPRPSRRTQRNGTGDKEGERDGHRNSFSKKLTPLRNRRILQPHGTRTRSHRRKHDQRRTTGRPHIRPNSGSRNKPNKPHSPSVRRETVRIRHGDVRRP